jgi:transposase
LREVYATASVREARRRLRRFHRHCADADVAELARLSKTVRSWEHEILGWHRTGLSNGPTEATNLLIKKVKRVGHGFRNFGNYRLRLLLHCGVQWQTRPVAAIRGRQPRLVA